MRASDFAPFVDSYKNIIDRVSRLSGERYEYFVGLRSQLIRKELGAARAHLLTGTMLDFGCGVGEAEKVLGAAFPGLEIVGVDTSAESIAKARLELGAKVAFSVLEDDRIDLESKSVDIVYSNGTFHHIPAEDRPGCMRELRRVLKRGGTAFVFENNPFNPFMTKAMRDNPFDEGVKPIAARALARTALEAGFSVQAIRYYFFFPHALRALRPLERVLRRVPLGAQYYLVLGRL